MEIATGHGIIERLDPRVAIAASFVKTGTALLLELSCEQLLDVFPSHQIGPRPTHKRKTRENHAETDGDGDDDNHFIVPSLQFDNTAEDCNTSQVELDTDHVLVWLQVPTSIVPVDGLLCVGVKCRYGEDSSHCFVLHVSPHHLSIPTGDAAAHARQFVYGPPKK